MSVQARSIASALCRRQMTEPPVGAGRRLLHQGKRPDQIGEVADRHAGDRKVLDRTQRVDAPIGVGGHVAFAQQVVLAACRDLPQSGWFASWRSAPPSNRGRVGQGDAPSFWTGRRGQGAAGRRTAPERPPWRVDQATGSARNFSISALSSGDEPAAVIGFQDVAPGCQRVQRKTRRAQPLARARECVVIENRQHVLHIGAGRPAVRGRSRACCCRPWSGRPSAARAIHRPSPPSTWALWPMPSERLRT